MKPRLLNKDLNPGDVETALGVFSLLQTEQSKRQAPGGKEQQL